MDTNDYSSVFLGQVLNYDVLPLFVDLGFYSPRDDTLWLVCLSQKGAFTVFKPGLSIL